MVSDSQGRKGGRVGGGRRKGGRVGGGRRKGGRMRREGGREEDGRREGRQEWMILLESQPTMYFSERKLMYIPSPIPAVSTDGGGHCLPCQTQSWHPPECLRHRPGPDGFLQGDVRRGKCRGYSVLSSVTACYQLTISRKAVKSLSQSEEVAS